MAVNNQTKPGFYSDGNNLYLQVTASGCKSWAFRYYRNGKARIMGLGPVRLVRLAEAREQAFDACRALRNGADPLQDKRAKVAAAAPRHTFRSAAECYVADHEAEWRNEKHRWQWSQTLETACAVMGDMDVAAITSNDVVSVLKPIWATKHVTASRLRGRIETVLDAAAARGWRAGDNPARLAGNLEHLLPAASKGTQVKHHAALPWGAMAGFMADLQQRDGTAALALRLVVLTAARTSGARGATWAEIDWPNAVWTVPGDRMKAGREHRVPLSPAVLAILAEARKLANGASSYVFPGMKAGKSLSNMAMLLLLRRMGRADLTTHGFRSSFRDWAAEDTEHNHAVVEMALAHAIKNKVESAYRRGDLLDKRRALMADWARHCGCN